MAVGEPAQRAPIMITSYITKDWRSET